MPDLERRAPAPVAFATDSEHAKSMPDEGGHYVAINPRLPVGGRLDDRARNRSRRRRSRAPPRIARHLGHGGRTRLGFRVTGHWERSMIRARRSYGDIDLVGLPLVDAP